MRCTTVTLAVIARENSINQAIQCVVMNNLNKQSYLNCSPGFRGGVHGLSITG